MERAAQEAGAEYIVLAGYMRILSEEFVSRWAGIPGDRFAGC